MISKIDQLCAFAHVDLSEAEKIEIMKKILDQHRQAVILNNGEEILVKKMIIEDKGKMKMRSDSFDISLGEKCIKN